MATIKDILQGLMNPAQAGQRMGASAAEPTKELLKKAPEGLSLLNQLLNADINELSNNGSNNDEGQSKGLELPTTPDDAKAEALVKAAEKKISEGAKETVDNMTPDQVSEIVAQSNQMKQAKDVQSQGTQPNNEGTNILKQLMDFVKSGGGIDEQGNAVRAEALGGFFKEHPSSLLQRQQAQALTPAAKREEAEIKATTDFVMEDFKQNRLDQREILKTQLENQGVGGGAATIGAGVSDLISAWDDIHFKGRAGGILGSLGGLVGIERGKRDAFTSFATGLAFSFGEHVLGQKGRAFTDNERKEITKNIIGASLNQTEGQFKSKMNAIIRQVNNRISEGGEKVPDFDTIRRNMKQKTSQSTQSGINNTIQQQIDDIDKKLESLGGR